MDEERAQREGLDERDELRENYRRLRYLIHTLSISLLILTGVVFVFIYRQVAVIQKQHQQIAPEAKRLIEDFESSGARAAIEDLRRELHAFSREHPDFRPIYERYFGTNEPPPAPAPAIAPAGTNAIP